MLNTNAFDNNRKRTSVVVRTSGGGSGGWGGATLLVKGADTCVMPFVDRANGACPYFDETQVRRCERSMSTRHSQRRTSAVLGTPLPPAPARFRSGEAKMSAAMEMASLPPSQCDDFRACSGSWATCHESGLSGQSSAALDNRYHKLCAERLSPQPLL